MARNKLRRFLAGLCTTMMLTQTLWDSGIAVMAQGNEETSVETMSGNEAEVEEETTDVSQDEAVSADAAGEVEATVSEESEKQTVSENDAVSENDTVSENETVSENDAVSENDVVSEKEAEEDPPAEGEEQENTGAAYAPTIEGGKAYSPQGVLMGTFDETSGELVIDKNLEVVPSFVFQGWDGIKKLSFAEGAVATTLGHNTKNTDGAFSKCLNLTEVDLSNATKLTTIKLNCFDGCTALNKITFNEKLNFIEKDVFKGCSSLESVTFEKELIQIGTGAFQNCKNLHTIVLKSAATKCEGAGVFSGCAINSFTLALDEEGKAVFPLNIFAKATFEEGAVIQIQDEVVEINENAFQGSNIEHVVLSKNLLAIQKNAFNGCTKLAEIDFSKCSIQTIEDNAFTRCTSLKTLVLPDTVTKLGSSAFDSCTGIVSLTMSSGTTDKDCLGTSVFKGCSSIEKLVFPEGHTYISASEFESCTGVTEITFSSTIKEIGSSAFKNCDSLSEVELPTNPDFTVIPDNCFAECNVLHKAEIREGIVKVGAGAFVHDNFYYSSLPDSLEYIGDNAFNTCSFSGTVILPEKMNHIGAAAFKGCRDQFGQNGYKELSKVVIKAKDIAECGTQIFNECMIAEIELPEGVSRIPANLFNQTTWVTDKAIVIPKTVKEIGKGAFAGAQSGNVGNLKQVVFEEGIQLDKIEEEAFAYNSTLESITLPDTLGILGKKAFANCTKLKQITIPENVTTMGESVFENCSLLEDIVFNAIAVSNSGRNIFKKCNIKSIVIGSKVTIFPDYLFDGAQFQQSESGAYSLVSLTIPAGVSKIGKYSLTNVVNLKSISFADGSVLKEIGEKAFSGCTNLKSISLPAGVETIGNYAFEKCAVMSGVELPAALSLLGTGAFKSCSAITKAHIPAGIETINRECFYGCEALVDLQMVSGKLKKIDSDAFRNCKSLKVVVIPDSVTMIGSNAFNGCTSLESVTIPPSVTNIGGGAFVKSECENTQFLVVKDSYAYKWLLKYGFEVGILNKITYELNGGINDPANPLSYKSGADTVLNAATRFGYTFKGWYLDAGFSQEILNLSGQDGDIILYAKWEINKYSITYHLDGGTNNSENPAVYTVEENISFKDATKTDKMFGGWYADSKLTVPIIGIEAGTKAENIVVYAKWTNERALEPVASIAGGQVNKGSVIYLSSLTEGAVIYYTTDGSEPTVKSTKYTDGVVIGSSLTLKAVAIKEGLDPSTVSVFEYTVADESKSWGEIDSRDYAIWNNDPESVEDKIWVAGVENVEYTGSAVTFDLRVYDYKTLLIEKKDYTVKYSNNKAAATKDAGKKAPTVTVTAKGNYKGKIAINFTITPISIDGDAFEAADMSLAVSGKVQKPVPVLTYNGKKLKAKKDFTVAYNDSRSGAYTAAGSWTITLNGCGNYGGSREVTLTISEGKSLAKAKISGISKKIAWTGSAITQDAAVVKLGKETLVKDKDYTIIYLNNVDAGTATMIVRGMGSYSGEKKQSFTILPKAKLSAKMIKIDKTVDWNGSRVTEVNEVVKNDSETLTRDKDYTMSFEKNNKVGKASVTIKGIGAYSGSVKMKFTIQGMDLSASGKAAEISFLDENGNVSASKTYGYANGGTKPAIRVNFDGKVLKEGADYTISYSKNTAVGEATLSVKGINKYRGTVKANFTVSKQSMSKLQIIGEDVAYKNKGGVVTASKTQVYDTNGNKLKVNADYTLSFSYVKSTVLENGGTVRNAGEAVQKSDVVPVNTVIKVTAEGKGNFEGSKYAYIRVYGTSIAKAKFKIDPQSYTGSEVCPDKSQIKESKLGLSANDYEIVSYTNNVKKGTAKVTLKGVGKYGGTKVVTFKIVEKNF